MLAEAGNAASLVLGLAAGGVLGAACISWRGKLRQVSGAGESKANAQ